MDAASSPSSPAPTGTGRDARPPGPGADGGAATPPPAPDAAPPAPEDARRAEAGWLVDAGGTARDGGPPADAGRAGDDAGEPPAGGQVVFVAVGYSGRRVRSLDRGLTWIDSVTSGGGGDDPHLLRAVTYAVGSFIAMGHRVWASPDGKTWTEREPPQKGGWIGGVQFGNGRLVATGGFGLTAWSEDGVAWKVGQFLDGQPGRSLAFGNGLFMSASDYNGIRWWSSPDGAKWTLVGTNGTKSNHVAFCDGAFKETSACASPWNGKGSAHADGVWLRTRGGAIQRSEDDGKTWREVLRGGLEDVAVGRVK